MRNALAQPEPALAETASRLLEQVRLGDALRVTPLSGGLNNRVYHVCAARGDALLKAYFQHPGDPRDRFAAEWAFATHAWRAGLRCIPEPLACLADRKAALFQFINGRAVQPGDVSPNLVDQSMQFVEQLNSPHSRSNAAALPDAVEACFSVGGHLELVDRRIARLLTIEPTDDVASQAVRFVRERLGPTWDRTRSAIEQRVAVAGIALDETLPDAHRCLSPSDFGFHNAILTAGDRLVFHDFEYAGWDDPTKLLGDFFHQPRVPAPRDAYGETERRMISCLLLPEAMRIRIRFLLPAYGVKWCCILLNEFLPVDRSRRRFATGLDQPDRRAAQLDKARRCLRNLDWSEKL